MLLFLDCDADDGPNDCTIPIYHGDLSESNLPESYKMWANNDNYLDWGNWESQGSYFDQKLGKDMDAFGTPGYWNGFGYVSIFFQLTGAYCAVRSDTSPFVHLSTGLHPEREYA